MPVREFWMRRNDAASKCRDQEMPVRVGRMNTAWSFDLLPGQEVRSTRDRGLLWAVSLWKQQPHSAKRLPPPHFLRCRDEPLGKSNVRRSGWDVSK
jgi:hypothetical protein